MFINTSRFDPGPWYSNLATFELAYSTDSTEELLAWAFKGPEQIYRPGYRYKKAGVMLNRLAPADISRYDSSGVKDSRGRAE